MQHHAQTGPTWRISACRSSTLDCSFGTSASTKHFLWRGKMSPDLFRTEARTSWKLRSQAVLCKSCTCSVPAGPDRVNDYRTACLGIWPVGSGVPTTAGMQRMPLSGIAGRHSHRDFLATGNIRVMRHIRGIPGISHVRLVLKLNLCVVEMPPRWHQLTISQ